MFPFGQCIITPKLNPRATVNPIDEAECTDQLALIKSDLVAEREAFPCGPHR